jgi:hypothetical protein
VLPAKRKKNNSQIERRNFAGRLNESDDILISVRELGTEQRQDGDDGQGNQKNDQGVLDKTLPLLEQILPHIITSFPGKPVQDWSGRPVDHIMTCCQKNALTIMKSP